MKNKISILLLAISLLLCLGTSCSDDYIDYEVYGSISGTVIDQEGQPISNATVTLLPDTHNTTTGNDGTFEFINLNPSQYGVRAFKEGYLPNTVNVTIKAGDHRLVSLKLPKDNN